VARRAAVFIAVVGMLALAACSQPQRVERGTIKVDPSGMATTTVPTEPPSSTTATNATPGTSASSPRAPRSPALGGSGRHAPHATGVPGPLPPPPGGGPLTGLAAAQGGPVRPALVVKIDNAPAARPQAGLNQADVVFVEQVEGGTTRFAAVFHSEDAPRLGPVRSARSTDIGIMSALGRPLFSYSGANKVFKEQVSRAPLIDVGVDRYPAPYRREGARPAPHNLFSTTASLFGVAPKEATAPPPLFLYDEPETPATGPGAVPVRHLHVDWPSRGFVADYDWDSSVWRRTQGGRSHLDAAGYQVAPANVIVQFVTYRNTGLVDPSGSPVPEAQVTGEGDAWVLTEGMLVPARWSKPDANAVTRYLDANGADIRLAPGRTWVELAPPGRASYVERALEPPAPAAASAEPAGAPAQEPQGTPDAPPSQPPAEPQPAPSPAPQIPLQGPAKTRPKGV
jgi:hypothetical protein